MPRAGLNFPITMGKPGGSDAPTVFYHRRGQYLRRENLNVTNKMTKYQKRNGSPAIRTRVGVGHLELPRMKE